MKTTLLTALTLLLAHTGLHAARFVNETSTLLVSAGDFDGDGDQDAVILHRASGVATLGIRQANGTLLFRPPAATGVPNTTGMAVGTLLDSTRDTLALTAPDANRVQIVNALDPSLHPQTATHPLAGPRLVAAANMPGVGLAGLDDLSVVAGWPGLLPAESRRLTNNGSGSFAASTPGFFNAVIRGWNPITLTRGGSVRLGFIEDGSPTATFRVAVPSVASLSFPASITGLPAGLFFIHGQFDAAESDFFFFTPGSTEVITRRILPSGTEFGPALTFSFPTLLRQLVRLEDAARDRVLIIPQSGPPAVYDYDGAGFTLVQELPLTGDIAEGATGIALGSGAFMLAHAGANGQLSASFSVFQKNGAGYLGIQSNIPLPKLDEAPSLQGNVFFFAGTPMRDESPPLVGQWSVGDWSSALALGITPQVSGELYQNTASGLSGLFNRAITPLPQGTLGALANQFMPDISVSNLHTAPAVLGSSSAGITFSPDTATKKRQAVQVILTASDPAAAIQHRTSTSVPFAAYAAPFWLFTDTTVEAFAVLPNGTRSAVVRASYAFDTETPPEKQDSDDDGVPDFVERSHNLDPAAGDDSDGDGFSDLDELLADTSPSDANDFPDSRPATADQWTLNITPLPLNGLTNTDSVAQTGVQIEVHDVGGSLLGSALTTAPANTPAASIRVDPVEAQQRLLVISTPAHFKLQTSDADKLRGRELVGLIAVPDAPVVEPNFSFNPAASLTSEAARWTAEYASARLAAQRPTANVTLDIEDTLTLLLVERRIGYISQFRGIGGSIDPPSLTIYREGEMRPQFGTAMSAEVLASLERPFGSFAPEFSPAIRVRELLAHVESLVANTSNDTGMVALKKVAREIYRVSSQSHNTSPGTYPPPFTTLRRFVSMGFLDTAYQSAVNLTSQELSDASSYIFGFGFNSATNRPVVTLTLKATGNTSPDGRTLVTSLGGSTTYSLLDARHRPYELPQSFLLPQGSQILVTAYNDLGPTQTPHPLEVLSLSLALIPLPSPTDRDGNLLADDWELLFFGHLGNDPFSSPDASDYSLLQRSLAGTDPTSGENLPAEPVVAFRFADIVPSASRDPVTGEYTLFFQWPTAYLGAFDFDIQQSSNLSGFTSRPATITHLGGGLHRAVIPGTTETRAFYRAAVRLR